MCILRLELENRLAAAEQQRALQDSTDQAQREEWEDRLHRVQQEEAAAHRELQSLRSNICTHVFIFIKVCVCGGCAFLFIYVHSWI